ncbi:MAG: hypothetical protein IJY15_13275 [Thermoguttaceae bacterium]|nr:hypothetical protein [Thermoguttaceae bacterium]
MKALYSLVLASGTKEALFAALWLALDEEPGTFADVDFASLRTTAARFGVALSESQIRKRVKELEKLDVLAVAPRRERGRFDLFVYQPAPNRFNVDATAPKPEPATPLFDAAFGKGVESFVGDGAAPDPRYRANSSSAPDRDRAVPGPRFRANSVSAPVGRDALAQLCATSDSAAVSETETRTETAAKTYATDVGVGRINAASPQTLQTPTFAEVRVVRPTSTIPAVSSVAPEPTSREAVAAPLEEINIKNKTINKPAKDFERLSEDVATNGSGNRVRAIPERPAAPRDGSRAVAVAPSVADVRSLVDFESPKVAAFRRLVARNVWERTIHPDLIDRIVALAALKVGGTDAKAVESMIRDAKAEVALWNRTDGRRGQPQIWRALMPEVKRLYENAGWVWSPTRFATEPRPEPRRVAETVDA